MGNLTAFNWRNWYILQGLKFYIGKWQYYFTQQAALVLYLVGCMTTTFHELHDYNFLWAALLLPSTSCIATIFHQLHCCYYFPLAALLLPFTGYIIIVCFHGRAALLLIVLLEGLHYYYLFWQKGNGLFVSFLQQICSSKLWIGMSSMKPTVAKVYGKCRMFTLTGKIGILECQEL